MAAAPPPTMEQAVKRLLTQPGTKELVLKNFGATGTLFTGPSKEPLAVLVRGLKARQCPRAHRLYMALELAAFELELGVPAGAFKGDAMLLREHWMRHRCTRWARRHGVDPASRMILERIQALEEQLATDEAPLLQPEERLAPLQLQPEERLAPLLQAEEHPDEAPEQQPDDEHLGEAPEQQPDDERPDEAEQEPVDTHPDEAPLQQPEQEPVDGQAIIAIIDELITQTEASADPNQAASSADDPRANPDPDVLEDLRNAPPGELPDPEVTRADNAFGYRDFLRAARERPCVTALPPQCRFEAARALWHEERGRGLQALGLVNQVLIRAHQEPLREGLGAIPVAAHLQELGRVLAGRPAPGRPGCPRCRWNRNGCPPSCLARRARGPRPLQPAAAAEEAPELVGAAEAPAELTGGEAQLG